MVDKMLPVGFHHHRHLQTLQDKSFSVTSNVPSPTKKLYEILGGRKTSKERLEVGGGPFLTMTRGGRVGGGRGLGVALSSSLPGQGTYFQPSCAVQRWITKRRRGADGTSEAGVCIEILWTMEGNSMLVW